MLFNSIEFIFFFIIVVAVYFAMPPRWRWIFLLAASMYFYMSWRAEYILLLLFSSSIDYVAGLLLARTTHKPIRVTLLCASLASNLGLLFLFKYYDFFSDSVRAVIASTSITNILPEVQFLLPIGISFYTFQALSYTIDVYRGAMKPERHYGIFLLYITFFPQLVAGPIERATRLLPQFWKVNTFEYQRVADGLKLIAWGMFKKVVIADRLAEYVNTVYGAPGEYTGLSLVLATYFFAFQIYCDFSGYSDIAIGSANVLGYDLMDNFRRPYFSKNIQEFWTRWHISLSTWFRDYLYIPLGGNRKGRARKYVNVFLTFVVSGLWHGANWTFIIWGALHGAYQIIGVLTRGPRDRMIRSFGLSPTAQKWWKIFVTFHLVAFSWIFFRAQDLSDALTIITNIPRSLNMSAALNVMSRADMIIAFGTILFLLTAELLQRKGEFRKILTRQPALVRTAAYISIFILILLFGKFGGNDFIYFQF